MAMLGIRVKTRKGRKKGKVKMYIGNLCNGIEIAKGGGGNTCWYYRRVGGDSDGKWGEGFEKKKDCIRWVESLVRWEADLQQDWAIDLKKLLKPE